MAERIQWCVEHEARLGVITPLVVSVTLDTFPADAETKHLHHCAPPSFNITPESSWECPGCSASFKVMSRDG